MSIVPLCLYENKNTGGSYISYPKKSRENDKDVFSCENKDYLQFITTFYAVNPDFFTIPTGMDMIFAEETFTDELHTIKIGQVYDPFNHEDVNTVKFIAWIEPVPYSTPLYIYEYGSNTKISLTRIKDEFYKEVFFSPIYVLIDPRQDAIRIPGSKGNFPIVNNLPVFLFSNYYGRCIPDDKGIELNKCVILHNKQQKELTLLERVGKENNKKEKSILNKTYLLIIIFCICFCGLIVKIK